MKNKRFKFLLVFFASIFINTTLQSDELEINSNKIRYDDLNKVTILEGNVDATDNQNNKIFTGYAKYDKKNLYFETVGETKVITSKGFEVKGEDIILDNNRRIISSTSNTIIIDKDGNKLFLEMFSYFIDRNIFFSKGNIKLVDNKNNTYNLSEVYVDEEKGKIVGTDVKVFLNSPDLKINSSNEPRMFANSISLSENQSTLEKGIFTYCKNRGEDKCPPWSLQSKKIKHNSSKKTIYYDNAILKIYDFPIFYFPKFSHPDPTVKRRSGFLVPTLTNSSSLGTGTATPYYWAINNDKDLTFTPKLYFTENPLMMAEYRQDFKDSFLIVDAGYTQGYKKTSTKKTDGGRAHFFSRFNRNLIDEENKTSDLQINLQKVSNPTYLKIYDVDTSIVNSDIDVLESTVDYTYQTESMYLGANASMYESLTREGRSKYEYLVPHINFEKNLLVSEQYGFFDLSSDLRVKNYDVNKQTEFFVNDFEWKSNKWISDSFGLENQLKGLVKTVNYNANNTDNYKTDNTNSEVSGALGFLTKIGLYKNNYNSYKNHLLTPTAFFRFAPGHMRNVDGGRLRYSNLFELNKVNEIDIVEKGTSLALGIDYKKNKLNEDNTIGEQELNFSVGQVISADENSDIPSSTSLDQRFSDVVGNANYKINDMLKLDYNFAIDQNYKEFNSNEIAADLLLDNAKFNVSYLEEKNHIGNQEYIKTGFDLEIDDSTELSFSTKRNLITNSAEFYNLSYNYINDCLKAGIVFRREFYTDRDIEPDNSLMFRISVIPFGDISSPKVSR